MKQYTKHLLLIIKLLLLGSILLSCTSNDGDSTSIAAIQSTDLIISKSSVIPVLDGKPTKTGIYIHNTTNYDIIGIKYDLTSNDVNKLSLVKDSCINIKAHSSCLLKLTTPELEPLNGGGAMLVANYNSKQSTELINYQYVDSSLHLGVTFGGASLDLNGSQDYGTTYVFVGNHGSANNVHFQSSNSSVSIVGGLINNQINIAQDEVVPLELMSSQNITSRIVEITPVEAVSLQNTYTQNISSNSLQVSITPVTIPNIIMANIPVLTQQVSTATVMLYNNGNTIASNISLTSNNNDILVQNGSPVCNTLIQDSSCKYIVSLNTESNSGSTFLTLKYHDINNNEYTKIITVYYRNGQNAPIIGVIPTQNELNQSINESRQVRFDVAHFRGENLTNASFNLVSKLTYSTTSIESNTCGIVITKNIPCHVIVNITATNFSESGIIYLALQGQASNQVYNFVSTPIKVSIADLIIPTIVSTVPANNESNVSAATGIQLDFSEPMNPLTLNKNNIKLFKVSGIVDVPLSVQSITNNNQTVNLTTGTQLLQNTEYKIVINPNKILDANGNAIDYSLNESSIVVFTTGIDITNPTIDSFEPADNAIMVSKTPTMEIQFSEAMDMASLTTDNIKLSTTLGDVFTNYQIYYESSNYTVGLILINGGELASNTTYQIILNEPAIKDLYGNSLGASIDRVLTTFTTSDYVAPTILMVNPSNGANNIPESTVVSITFSESMNTSTLVENNIKLKNNKTSTDIALSSPSYSNNNHTVTFTPIVSLVEAESYSIIINPSEIKDMAGNPVDSSSTSEIISVFKVTGFGLVYVIPVPINGNLGQDSGGDSKCQAAGSQLIEGSTWKALLAFNNSTTQYVKYYRFNPSSPPTYKGVFIGFGRQIDPIHSVESLSAPISETITGSFWFGAMEVTFESEQRISLIDRCYNMDTGFWWGTDSSESAGSVARLNSTTPFNYIYPDTPTVMCNESRYLTCIYTDN